MPGRHTQCSLSIPDGDEAECLEITDLMTEIFSCPMMDAFLINIFWLFTMSFDGRQTQTATERDLLETVCHKLQAVICAPRPSLQFPRHSMAKSGTAKRVKTRVGKT